MKIPQYLILLIIMISPELSAQNYDDLWLRYEARVDRQIDYDEYFETVAVLGESPILVSVQEELQRAVEGIYHGAVHFSKKIPDKGLVIASYNELPRRIRGVIDIRFLNREGYVIKKMGDRVLITAKEEIGLLYGTFHWLRLVSSKSVPETIDIVENPKIKIRFLNHWDNPGKVPPGQEPVERGYAGGSIFEWNQLPEIQQRYIDYARLLASVGINGTVVNNVNTAKHGLEGWKLLTPEYLPKLKSLAEIFRRYGIKLYISVNYFSPIIIDDLPDADPLNPQVQKWWKDKVAEIYAEIPDFGGFLVKADSEGEPGPMKYGRNHAQGADVLANALEPFGGIVMWRAFVYSGKNQELSEDRAFQAYQIFKPLDGAFPDNSLVQIKNGPIDFQVREPVSPLFGAMPGTNQLLELQITQEYTGWDKHVCYLLPQWKEILEFDTYSRGPGSTVASVVDGSLYGYEYSGVAGVSNVGDDYNWTGHYLAQANFYAFGRLVWNPDLSSQDITREWIRLTFGDDPIIEEVVSEILLTSWRTYENYTSPLGVGLMTDLQHFYPDPERRVNFHRANRYGVGYDRTMATGSGYTEQYADPVRSMYENIHTCPEEHLLFFHHVPYDHQLQSGKTVIQHIYDTHNEGVEKVKEYVRLWQSLEGRVDQRRFDHILERLIGQVDYARQWRDTINNYFEDLSGIKSNQLPRK